MPSSSDPAENQDQGVSTDFAGGLPPPRPGPAPAPPALLATRVSPQEEEPPPAPVGLDPRDYQLVERVSGGGMGDVYRTHDPALRRDLALKVIAPRLQGDRQAEHRFLREARVTGFLQHPNIVPVHNLGRLADGRLFFTMKLVRGRTLAERLEESAGKTDHLPTLLGIFEKVCDAVAYAHSKGVIHRDLKPANVMVGEFGEVQVMDWGLAKLLRAEETQADEENNGRGTVNTTEWPAGSGETTQAGSLLGTLAYMPPEQACGKVKQIDERSDVFSLGAILCEILTGSSPYTGHDRSELARQAELEDAHTRLETCGADAELTGLCRECLTEAQDGRPRDAGVLAKRVAEFQARVQERLRQAELERTVAEARAQEEHARATLEQERAREAQGRAAAEGRARQRLRIVAGLALAFVVALLLGTGIAWRLAVWALGEKGRADNNAAKAQTNQEEAIRRLYVSDMRLAPVAWEQGRISQLLELLDRQRPERTGDLELRGFEWYYWDRRCHSALCTLHGHSGAVWCVAFSHDGKQVASAGEDGTVKVWDAADGQERHTFRGHLGPVYAVAFNADGSRLASGGADGSVRLWDTASGRESRTFPGHTAAVNGVAFSPDGKRFASGGTDKWVRVWDTATGAELLAKMHTGPVYAVTFSPNGSYLALASSVDFVAIWDAVSGKSTFTPAAHGHWVTSDGHPVAAVAFSPDGKRVTAATGGIRLKFGVWDVPGGHMLLEIEEIDLAGVWTRIKTSNSVTFSPNGQLLASGAEHGLVTIWDAANGRSLRVHQGHTARVTKVVFDPKGERLASASADGTVKIWDNSQIGVTRHSGKDLLWISDRSTRQRSIAFHPDSNLLAWGGQDGSVKLWDIAAVEARRRFLSDAGPVFGVAFSLNGRMLAALHMKPDAQSGAYVWSVVVWDTTNGHKVLHHKTPTLSGSNVAISPDGQTVAWGETTGTVRVWDVPGDQELFTLHGHTSRVHSVTFSPDGLCLASASADRTTKIWNLQNRAEERSLKGAQDQVVCLAFSRDGHRLATGGMNATASIWDVTSGAELVILKGHVQPLLSVAFSDDGRRLVSSSVDKTIRFWEGVTGQELMTFPQGWNWPPPAFSPDGLRLAFVDPLGAGTAVFIFDPSRAIKDAGHAARYPAVID